MNWAELVRLTVDVIVTDGTASALAAKQATNTIPIVMVYVADPVGNGLVTSLARPGGNVTGLSVLSPGIVQKALGILREIAPRISRVGVWMDPTNPGQTLLDEQMNAAARILGITPQRVDVRSAEKLDGAFAAALEQRMEALFVYPLPIAPPERQRIVQFGIKNRTERASLHPPANREVRIDGLVPSRCFSRLFEPTDEGECADELPVTCDPIGTLLHSPTRPPEALFELAARIQRERHAERIVADSRIVWTKPIARSNSGIACSGSPAHMLIQPRRFQEYAEFESMASERSMRSQPA
jgi:hypothetical protein